jgi:hypothetical protein
MKMNGTMFRRALLSALVLASLGACVKAKEQAVVAVDEAKLNLASARRLGAEKSSRRLMNQASAKLRDAQDALKAGRHSSARKLAQEASSLAAVAQGEAKAAKAASDAAKAAQTKRRKSSGKK